MVSGITLNSTEEAIGMTRAAVAQDLPIVISFRLDKTGRLATGPSLKEAIGQTA